MQQRASLKRTQTTQESLSRPWECSCIPVLCCVHAACLITPITFYRLPLILPTPSPPFSLVRPCSLPSCPHALMGIVEYPFPPSRRTSRATAYRRGRRRFGHLHHLQRRRLAPAASTRWRRQRFCGRRYVEPGTRAAGYSAGREGGASGCSGEPEQLVPVVPCDAGLHCGARAFCVL